MKIVPFDDANWKKDHPSGLILFQHMLQGDPKEPDNFMYILARQDGDFLMPRHRHNFDQIRLPISGDMNLGCGAFLKEGQIGYFPEGLAYGPQQDLGKRLQVVLQFAGASNYGFMSIEERRTAMAELSGTGKFVGPHFHHADGKVEWALNAIWRHVYGTTLKYPRSRYASMIVAEPKYFNWLHLAGSPGVDHKYMGSFSERGVWVEMVRLKAGATWVSTHDTGRRLLFVLGGDGEAEKQAIGKWGSMQADATETLHLRAVTDMEIFLIGLPPVQPPAVESDEYDDEELPAEEPASA